MFCTNCGKEVNGKFCSNCGTPIVSGEAVEQTEKANVVVTYPPIKEPYVVYINGISCDLHSIIRDAGGVKGKEKAYKALVRRANISSDAAERYLNPLFDYHGSNANIKTSIFSINSEDVKKASSLAYEKRVSIINEKAELKKRLKEYDSQGIPYCPKCNSTSLTAQKKGFGFGKAAVGAVATGGIGLLAGGIGSNKVELTCLNCGHKFKPGKK